MMGTFSSVPQDVTMHVWQPCPWCGRYHSGSGRCPSVKAIEYHPNGSIKRVEYASSLAPCTLPHTCPECGCSWEPNKVQSGGSPATTERAG